MAQIIPLPDIARRTRPAADPLPRLALWWARINLRHMLRTELLPQPDSVMRDAGWTRAEAMAEVSKPFWRA